MAHICKVKGRPAWRSTLNWDWKEEWTDTRQMTGNRKHNSIGRGAEVRNSAVFHRTKRKSLSGATVAQGQGDMTWTWGRNNGPAHGNKEHWSKPKRKVSRIPNPSSWSSLLPHAFRSCPDHSRTLWLKLPHGRHPVVPHWPLAIWTKPWDFLNKKSDSILLQRKTSGCQHSMDEFLIL